MARHIRVTGPVRWTEWTGTAPQTTGPRGPRGRRRPPVVVQVAPRPPALRDGGRRSLGSTAPARPKLPERPSVSAAPATAAAGGGPVHRSGPESGPGPGHPDGAGRRAGAGRLAQDSSRPGRWGGLGGGRLRRGCAGEAAPVGQPELGQGLTIRIITGSLKSKQFLAAIAAAAGLTAPRRSKPGRGVAWLPLMRAGRWASSCGTG
jgi:hypothetical protein